MGIISTKCVNCGADLSVDDSREFAFCQYCGHKLIISSIQKTEHTTIIHNEAEIIRAKTEARELELAEKRRKKAAWSKLIVKLIKFALLPLVALGVYLILSNLGTNYRLVNSTAYTEKAFNISPEQLMERFLETDTRSVSEFGLQYTDWRSSDKDEEFFTSRYNTLYHGEHQYTCLFYIPVKNNEEPIDIDENVLYWLYVQTDNENRIIHMSLFSQFRDQTLAGKDKLNGYFGTTIIGEFFSILSSQKGDFVLKKFEKAKNGLLLKYTDDGKVRYHYMKNDDGIAYSMQLIY